MDFWPEPLFLEHSFQLWTDPNLVNIIKHHSNNLPREMLQPWQSYYFTELRKKIRTMKVNEKLTYLCFNIVIKRTLNSKLGTKGFRFFIYKRRCWTRKYLLTLNIGKMHTCMLSFQLCPALCNPTHYSPPGFSVPGILQARILDWVAISSSRGSLGKIFTTNSPELCKMQWGFKRDS